MVEEALEERRPRNSLSRYRAVFSAETTDFHRFGLHGGFIHRVLVEPSVEVHDLYWIGKLMAAESNSRAGLTQSASLSWAQEVIDSLCSRYWSGEESPDPIWEYLSAEAVVAQLISEEYVMAKDTVGGWPGRAVGIGI
jgi:hypothetical protein